MDGAFKPLVFGGTYPIDEPATPMYKEDRVAILGEEGVGAGEAERRRELRATVERSLERFEAMLAQREGRRRRAARGPVRTFDIDEPVELWEAGTGAGPAAPRDHAHYYVAGPSTYDIDEPTSFI
ncbi:hypothetical protein RR46_14631 [Papilio xuthus]|uniref:Uncharacterized protein n=1 Tax=Papilio xuthus TaxID=66420 RepID=A0A194PD20_PAPXU|nr:hypothetical protein RR46_14631 [Papilio xuthus]